MGKGENKGKMAMEVSPKGEFSGLKKNERQEIEEVIGKTGENPDKVLENPVEISENNAKAPETPKKTTDEVKVDLEIQEISIENLSKPQEIPEKPEINSNPLESPLDLKQNLESNSLIASENL